MTSQPIASTSGIPRTCRKYLYIPNGQAFKKVYNCLLRFQSSLLEGCESPLLMGCVNSEGGGGRLSVSLGPSHLQQSVPGVGLQKTTTTALEAAVTRRAHWDPGRDPRFPRPRQGHWLVNACGLTACSMPAPCTPPALCAGPCPPASPSCPPSHPLWVTCGLLYLYWFSKALLSARSGAQE